MSSEFNLFRPECFLNDEEQRRYEENVEQKIRAFNTATGDSAQPAETVHIDICLNVFKEMVGSRPRLLKVWCSVSKDHLFLVQNAINKCNKAMPIKNFFTILARIITAPIPALIQQTSW